MQTFFYIFLALLGIGMFITLCWIGYTIICRRHMTVNPDGTVTSRRKPKPKHFKQPDYEIDDEFGYEANPFHSTEFNN